MFPYNIVETQSEDLIAKAAEKNIGFICMKPLAGGAIEDATLALRYVCANPNVTVVIPGMAEPKELRQNLAAASDTSELTQEEKAGFQRIRSALGTQFCRRCNYCQPCSAGINISGAFLFDGYLQRYGLADWARSRYMAMEKKARVLLFRRTHTIRRHRAVRFLLPRLRHSFCHQPSPRQNGCLLLRVGAASLR